MDPRPRSFAQLNRYRRRFYLRGTLPLAAGLIVSIFSASPAQAQVVTADSLSERDEAHQTPTEVERASIDRDTTEQDRGERLSDQAELDRIIELYMAGSYRQCSDELGDFLDTKSPGAFDDTAVIERGRLYFASCALLEGRRHDARMALHSALEENPLMRSPDSLTFPPPVVSLFLEVRDEVQQLIAAHEKEQVIQLRRENELARRKAEQRREREAQLEKLARQESVIVRGSRWGACVPLGFGQFQNGDQTLGTVFLVTEGLLLATALTSGIILSDLTNTGDGNVAVSTRTDDGSVAARDRHNAQLNSAYTTMRWSSWALIGVAALGVLEAQLSFKKERLLETRERELPPEVDATATTSPKESSSVRISPTFGVSPQGGYLGVNGSF